MYVDNIFISGIGSTAHPLFTARPLDDIPDIVRKVGTRIGRAERAFYFLYV